MCCERLKWMAHDHGVQNLISEAWHYQLSCWHCGSGSKINNIDCFVYLSSKLEHTSSPGCRTMHWQILTSSPSVSWCRSLGMLRMSCISRSTTTGAIWHADGSGTTSIACDNLKMNNMRTNSILSAAAGCDGHHRAEGYIDWLKVDCASRTSVSQTAARKVANSPHQFSHKSTCEPEAVQAVFQRQGHKVRFGSIKHWLRRDNLALHHHLFT